MKDSPQPWLKGPPCKERDGVGDGALTNHQKLGVVVRAVILEQDHLQFKISLDDIVRPCLT